MVSHTLDYLNHQNSLFYHTQIPITITFPHFNVLTQIPILLPSSALAITLAISMATEEPTVVVDPTPEPAATESPPEEKEEPKSEAKAKKSKEPKPKKVSRPRNPPTHPSYEEVQSELLFSRFFLQFIV